MLRLKRVYEAPQKEDGFRILVGRLWPRGLSKERAKIDLWLKEIAPSDALRKWFSHDPAKWDEFRKRYAKELKGREELLENVRRLEKEKKVVTLVFAAKDEEHNNAVALGEILKM